MREFIKWASGILAVITIICAIGFSEHNHNIGRIEHYNSEFLPNQEKIDLATEKLEKAKTTFAFLSSTCESSEEQRLIKRSNC